MKSISRCLLEMTHIIGRGLEKTDLPDDAKAPFSFFSLKSSLKHTYNGTLVAYGVYAFFSTGVILLSSCFFSSLLAEVDISTESMLVQGLEVQLKDPTYSDGILSTDQGGIVTAPGIRLQAQKIKYIHRNTSQGREIKILAEGDLLVEYEGQYLAGESLEYDCIEHKGVLQEGRTQEGIWFVGGKKIELKPDGGLVIHDAFVTTSESQENLWGIHAQSVNILPSHRIQAKEIRLDFFQIPVLWLPSFKTSTKFVSDPPIRYRLIWDRSLGPRATIRYRVLSKNNLDLFARLDYRLDKGFGGAIESEYESDSGRTTCVTRSYAAHDKVVFDESTYHRYRLQGLFTHLSEDEKTTARLSYDKFSDLKMISDFASSDFEINTQKRTEFRLRHQEESFYGSFIIEPRLNTFESVNQKLPFAKIGVKPFALGSTEIFSENSVTAGYLDYVYASDLLHKYPSLKETHSARLGMRNRLYRPSFFGPLYIEPTVGLYSFLYSNNQNGNSVGQCALTYGGKISSPFRKNYGTWRHLVEPYCYYQGMSRPVASLSDHYVFLLEDGLYQINSLQVGCRNGFSTSFNRLLFDIYAYHFFFSDTLTGTFPKAYLLTTWDAPSFRLENHTCWNFEEGLLDFCNFLGEFTANANLAFILEFRHRSRFDWRKANHENFLVDMARTIDELLESPLSDGRNTFLAQAQIKLSPKWSCRFGSHYGWGRATEPAYSSFKIDTTTLLSCRWQLKFSYMHTTNDDRFAMQVQLRK